MALLPVRLHVDQDVVQFIAKFISGKNIKKKEKTLEEREQQEKERERVRAEEIEKIGRNDATTTPAKAQEMMFFQSCEIRPLRIFILSFYITYSLLPQNRNKSRLQAQASGLPKSKSRQFGWTFKLIPLGRGCISSYQNKGQWFGWRKGNCEECRRCLAATYR